jgi:hypothetical protein
MIVDVSIVSKLELCARGEAHYKVELLWVRKCIFFGYSLNFFVGSFSLISSSVLINI